MGNAPVGRLSGDEVRALKFVAHRQLARWAKKPSLGSRQHSKRNALKRAVRVLQDQAFAQGCELRPDDKGGER
jgi:hypothetical protein